MAKYFGIDFIPLMLPLERRFQLIAVMIHILNFSVFPILSILVFLYLLLTQFWWMSVGYMAWMIYDIMIKQTSATGGRRSEWLRKGPFMQHFRDYFPVTLEKTVDLDPNKNYVMGYHPHGILSCGAFCNFGSDATGFSEKFPGVTPYLLTLETNFRWPILRGYTLWMGK